jgi:hypothetical protein
MILMHLIVLYLLIINFDHHFDLIQLNLMEPIKIKQYNQQYKFQIAYNNIIILYNIIFLYQSSFISYNIFFKLITIFI